MRIILLKDIPKIGHKNDVKNVSDGYAQNFLFPQKLAKIATEEIIKEIEEMKKRGESEKKMREVLINKETDKLNNTILEIKSKLNERGHLFAGVHVEEISKELEKKIKIKIDPEYIQLEQPIKEAGEHEVKIKIGEREVKIKIVIIGK